MKKALWILISSLLLNSCTNFSHETLQRDSAKSKWVRCHRTFLLAAPIHQVIVQGNVHLIIYGHDGKNTLTADGDRLQLATLNVSQKNGILTIATRRSLFNAAIATPITVQLDIADDINRLVDHGQGTLSTRDIGYQAIDVDLAGKLKARMRGNTIVLQKVKVTDQANLNAYWVNSTNLTLWLKNQAQVFLGGVVTQIAVKAEDASDFNGRYLRVQQGFVKTKNKAYVSLLVKKALATISTNDSTVAYYRDPDFGDHYLGQSGSALRMTGID